MCSSARYLEYIVGVYLERRQGVCTSFHGVDRYIYTLF